MSLRKGLQADSEDELLQMQAEFQASGKAPAAKVAGVRSKTPAGPPTHPITKSTPPPQEEPSEGVPDVPPQSETSEGWQIVGDVCERQPQSSPAPQLAPAVSSTAFPKATHRRVSKFALSRRAKGTGLKPGDSSTETAAPSLSKHHAKEPPPMPGVPVPSDSAHSTGQGTASVPSQGSTPAAMTGGPSNSRDDERQMAREVAAENQKLIASMEPDQVEKARQEIRERLDPSILAFLEKRAAQRKAQHTASVAASAGIKHEDSANSQQQEGESRAEGRAPGASKLKTPAEQQGLLQSSLQHPVEESGSPGESVLARMSFDADGRLVAVRDAAAAAVPATERDILRQDEGALGSGYTVQEMCQLARSALPAQRAFACRLLAAILARTQQGLRGNPTSKPADMPQDAAQTEEVTWQDMWRHLTGDCEAALVLRLALDDANSGVIAAAAAGLHALLDSRGGASQDDFPDLELPAVPARRLERPHPSAAWMSLYPAQESEDPSFPQNAAEAAVGRDDAADPRQLAKHDTLAALLHMQVLDRIKYLLTSAAAPGALQPLLALLGDLALGGADVAHAICDTPGLVAGLMAILDLRSAAAASQTAKTEQAARPAALRVLCLLCCGGAPIARRLLAEGLESRMLLFVVQPALQTAGGQSAEQVSLQLQVIALRIWRVLAAMGLSSLPLEDAYPALCRRLEPCLNRPLIADPLAQDHADLEASISAEALGVFWAAFQHDAAMGEGRCILADCSASVRRAAAVWLQGPAVERLRISLGLCMSLETGARSLNRPTCALLSAYSTALSIVALDKDSCAEELSALAIAVSGDASNRSSGLLESLFQLLRAKDVQTQDAETNDTWHEARAFQAASAALRACMKALKEFYPKQAADLAIAALTVLTEDPATAGSLQDKMCIEPWHAMQLEKEQSRAATLVTSIELLHSLSEQHANGTAAANHLYGYARELCDMLMWALTMLPPGAEDLALRALSCLLAYNHSPVMYALANAELDIFLSGRRATLAEAALRQAAWWQQDAEKAKHAQLPNAEQLKQTLLRAYARHWLGLVPEGPRSTAAAAMPLVLSSCCRQPVGSRLPLPADWPFHVGLENDALEREEQSELASIPEEEAGGPSELGSAAACLLFLLRLEIGPGRNPIHTLPIGAKVSRVLDLLFGTALETPISASSAQPWTDPLLRQTAAALLNHYLWILFPGKGNVSRSLACITEADAARWATEFATVSFGDPLLASAVALLLLPQMPPGVQVTVLDVLDQEGALHLLPSMEKAPSLENYAVGQNLYGKTEPPAEVLRVYRQLLDEGSLRKAHELGSLPHGIATKWA